MVQARIAARSSGTTVVGIEQFELRCVELPLWPLEVQCRIGEVLSVYDDLITVNQRRIAILEEMARRLFVIGE